MLNRLVPSCLAALMISAVGTMGRNYIQLTRQLQSGLTNTSGTNEVPSLADYSSGDPMIMGLSGQHFKFAGRNGSWYSAVSTKSFQWNLKLHNYENCPKDAHTFVNGAGFIFFDKEKISKRIEVNVVSPYNVDVGCGSNSDHCLGAGSLELVIDGVKHTVGGDYKTKDGLARVVAYNSFHQCSRRFFDVEIQAQRNLRRAGSLEVWKEATVFDVIEGIKATMNDPEECEKWIHDRIAYSDLFEQPGHCSTILIKTEDVNIHLEYKQENERCNAHSIDVWVSSVSPKLFAEEWSGLIGETKDNDYVPDGKQTFVDRLSVLKYSDDKDYEVSGSLSRKCKGCYQGD